MRAKGGNEETGRAGGREREEPERTQRGKDTREGQEVVYGERGRVVKAEWAVQGASGVDIGARGRAKGVPGRDRAPAPRADGIAATGGSPGSSLGGVMRVAGSGGLDDGGGHFVPGGATATGPVGVDPGDALDKVGEVQAWGKSAAPRRRPVGVQAHARATHRGVGVNEQPPVGRRVWVLRRRSIGIQQPKERCLAARVTRGRAVGLLEQST